MDYAAHGFWIYIIFHRIKRPIYAVLFGLLPDTLSWAIYVAYRLLSGGTFGKPVISQIPEWVFVLYNISHSLFVAAFVILVIFIILRRVPIYVFAWPIAIVMDLLTHRRDFLPTPFLWPFSDWAFPGISWGTWQFIVINYSAICISSLLIFIFRRHKRQKDLSN